MCVGWITFITCTNAKALRYLENIICLDVWLYTALYYAAMGRGPDSYPPFPFCREGKGGGLRPKPTYGYCGIGCGGESGFFFGERANVFRQMYTMA